METLKKTVEEQGKAIAKLEKELKKLRKEADPAPAPAQAPAPQGEPAPAPAPAPAPQEPATAPAKKLVKGTVAALFGTKK